MFHFGDQKKWFAVNDLSWCAGSLGLKLVVGTPAQFNFIFGSLHTQTFIQVQNVLVLFYIDFFSVSVKLHLSVKETSCKSTKRQVDELIAMIATDIFERQIVFEL